MEGLAEESQEKKQLIKREDYWTNWEKSTKRNGNWEGNNCWV